MQQELKAIRGALVKQRQVIQSLRRTLVAMDETGDPLYDVPLQDEGYISNGPARSPERTHHPFHGVRARHPPATRIREIRPVMRARRFGNSYPTINHDFAKSLEMESKLSPTDRGGFRALFTTECARLINRRELEIQNCSQHANELERRIASKTNWQRNRQEDAIFAFTVVTSIFLPLSSIASIFGMNTTGVRDMSSGQWLYWAVAIPVTGAVILGGLWWMGELGNLARRVTAKTSSRSNSFWVNGQPPEVKDKWGHYGPGTGDEYMVEPPMYPGLGVRRNMPGTGLSNMPSDSGRILSPREIMMRRRARQNGYLTDQAP